MTRERRDKIEGTFFADGHSDCTPDRRNRCRPPGLKLEGEAIVFGVGKALLHLYPAYTPRLASRIQEAFDLKDCLADKCKTGESRQYPAVFQGVASASSSLLGARGSGSIVEVQRTRRDNGDGGN